MRLGVVTGSAPVAAPKAAPAPKGFSLPATSKVAMIVRDRPFAPSGPLASPTAGLNRSQLMTYTRDRAFAPKGPLVANPTIGQLAAERQQADLTHTTAAIRASLVPDTSFLGRFVSNLIGQGLGLPMSTLQGVEALGGATGQAIGGNPAPLGHLLSSAVTHDPIVEAISQGSLQPLAQNPLNTVLDATGLYGLAGKSAGALARAGQLGDAAKAAAALGGREDLLAAPEIPGTAISRGFSPNLFTHAIQSIGDKFRDQLLPQSARVARGDQLIRKMVAQMHAAHMSARGAAETTAIKALQAVKPGRHFTEERAVAPLLVGTGGGREVLEQILANMEREVPKHPDTLASRETAMATIRKALAKDDRGAFDWSKTQRVAEAYAPMQSRIEALKAQLGMVDTEQMARRAMNERALLEPNVHMLETPTKNPVLQQAVRDLAASKRQAARELKLAQSARDAYLGPAGVRGAYQGASNALAQITRAIPLHPETDALLNRALDLRQILEETHPRMTAFHESTVAEKAAALKNIAGQLEAARIALQRNKLRGTMIEDERMPPLTHGPLKGMRVRPITADDLAALRARDAATGGTGVGAYVTRVNPEREAIPTLNELIHSRNEPLARTAEMGRKKYTGEALIAGDYRSGWSALAQSQLRDIHAVHSALEDQAFLDRFSLHDDKGISVFHTPTDAEIAARAYTERTGIKAIPVPDRAGEWRVIPESAVTELRRQRGLDSPSALGKLLTTPNAIFRKTVLPYSAKLPIMHTVENVSRTLLLEKGNPIRAAMDYRRFRNFLDALPEDKRAMWEGLVTPGSLSRTGASGELEDLGRVPTEHPLPVAAIKGIVRGLDVTSTTIIKGQRWLEKRAQTVAGGVYLRQQLREMGHSFLDAETAVNRYADKLAQGIATEADAERAANLMHRVYGQYNAFTARSRMILRVMPFAPWYLNAARLVFDVLPRDHPLFDALLQDVHNATAQQWNQQHLGLPSDLQTAVSVGPNAWLDVGKLTPLLPNQNPLATVSQLALPWASSAALALAGKDPFMADLKGPNTPYGQSAAPSGVEGPGWQQSALSAIEQLAEALGGPLNDVARIAYSHGGTLYNTDTPVLHLLSGGQVGHVDVKPGSTKQQRGLLHLPGALDKVLDPFHPTTFAARGRGGTFGIGTSLAGAKSGFNLSNAGESNLSNAGESNLSGVGK